MCFLMLRAYIDDHIYVCKYLYYVQMISCKQLENKSWRRLCKRTAKRLKNYLIEVNSSGPPIVEAHP